MNATQTTKNLTFCALFAALTAVLSQIAIPLGTVPLNFAMLAVFLAGGLLNGKNAALSQIVYVLLGAIGIPVFTGFTGGLGIIIGPTGGYIVGYIAAAGLIGFLTSKRSEQSSYTGFLALAMTAGMLLCYVLGTLWFMFVTGTALIPSLSICVIPFLPGDALKIVAAVLLTKRLKKTKML